MKKLILVTGASGTGKSTVVKKLEEKKLPGVVCCFFDSIGVPSHEERVAKYGSGTEWQRQETINWVKRIKDNYLSENIVVLDGQSRPAFIVEACTMAGITDYKIIVFVCEDQVRNRRLVERGQAHLVNKDMSNWNTYLGEQAVEHGYRLIETSKFEIEELVTQVQETFRLHLI